MEAFRPREVVQRSWLWSDPDGGQWLLVFSFAMIAGRLQCCGMEMRSFLRDEVAGDEVHDPYPAYWSGDPETLDEMIERSMTKGVPPSALDVEVGAPPDRPGLEDDLPLFNAEAVGEALAGGASEDTVFPGISPEMARPRPLRATTLRSLPLAKMMVQSRRLGAHGADEVGSAWSFILETGDVTQKAYDAWLAERRAMWTPKRRRGGRVMKYTHGELKQVADLYTKAFTSGSRSPTRDLAQVLGLNRNLAAKLVVKARAAGLLGPAKGRTAGGILAEPQTQDQPRQRLTGRRSNDDEGGTRGEEH